MIRACYYLSMVITYYGQAMVKFQLGDMVILANPISKEFDPKAPKMSAGVVLVGCSETWADGRGNVGNSDQPFVIDGPGEYEIKGVFIQGMNTVGPAGEDDPGQSKINTAYTIDLEGIRTAYLGALASEDLAPEVVEELGFIDIAVVPVGGHGTLEAKKAAKLITTLAPKMVIPILYQEDVTGSLLSTFLEEIGAKDLQSQEKIALKPKDLVGLEAEVTVLAPVNKS